ncbi:MAG: imidazolonepropionase [Bacteroidaceae bacterium]|nr:imidazolonepropionase [Bacteroidaceae bacterium]
MDYIITDISRLYGIDTENRLLRRGKEMSEFPYLENAWLHVKEGKIAGFGSMDEESVPLQSGEVWSASGAWLFPSFCDSHTHLVYAGSREGEFVDKIRGLSYEEIARRGGGILNSADRLHATSEDELYAQAMERVHEIMAKGTGAVEIKSGYGLNTEDELKMLRVIRRIRETAPLVVRSTFLGAHAVGRDYQGRQSDYVDMLIHETIPEVGRQRLADFIDVFCDRGFFTPDETARLLEAGAKWGMRPKIHGQELADSGGVEVAVHHHALSVDHLESMTDRDIELLKRGTTVPTALPGTSFFLNMPFAPCRRIIDAGLPLALASDYNPGSTPSGDMKFCVSLACIKQRLLPAEAMNAATLNSAAAMGVSDEVGSIAVGKRANYFMTDALPSLDYLPYAYTTPLVQRVVLGGMEISQI